MTHPLKCPWAYKRGRSYWTLSTCAEGDMFLLTKGKQNCFQDISIMCMHTCMHTPHTHTPPQQLISALARERIYKHPQLDCFLRETILFRPMRKAQGIWKEANGPHWWRELSFWSAWRGWKNFPDVYTPKAPDSIQVRVTDHSEQTQTPVSKHTHTHTKWYWT